MKNLQTINYLENVVTAHTGDSADQESNRNKPYVSVFIENKQQKDKAK